MSLPTLRTAFGWRLALAFWLAVPLLLTAWLVARDLVPNGRLTVACWGTSRCSLLRGPIPEARVVASRSTMSGQTVVRVINEPVYFDVYQSRPFRTAAVRIVLDPGNARLIELGVAAGAGAMPSLQPLYHRALERLATDPAWSVRQDEAVVLWQRGSTTYPTVSAFLLQPPVPDRVAVYRTSVTLPYQPQLLSPDGPGAGIDYLLTSYHSVGVRAEQEATVTFSLTPEQSAADTLRFVFSLPERPLPTVAPQVSAFTVQLEGEIFNRRVLRGWLSRWFRPAR